jgi:hypothetical protein
MFDSLFADLGSGLAEKVAGYAIKCLAVAGGFLIGYFLGKVVAWGLDRWVFAQKAPDQLKKAVSFVSGLALAILVALIVFGEGGNGLFGHGGGTGDGKGTTPTNDGKTQPATPPTEPKKDEVTPKKDEPIKPPSPKPTPGDMHVIILAGDEVKDKRFYLIGGDSTPKALPEFQDAINARRKLTEPALKTVYYRFKNEELSPGHQAIKDPYLWLESLKIGFVPE